MAVITACMYVFMYVHVTQATLDVLVARRDAIMDQLQKPVLTSDLPALRAVLELLQEVDNLNLTIDNEYLPVENMYSLLK